MALTILAVCLIILVTIFLWKEVRPVDKQLVHQYGQRKARMPPGPKGPPIIGNLLQLFEAYNSGRLFSWLCSLAQYGDMTTLHLGSQCWVMLNHDTVIHDIINKHGSITNERPFMPIASGLVGNDSRSLLRQSASWAEGRRLMHHLLSGTALQRYGNWQEHEAAVLMSSMLAEPAQWYNHLSRFSTAVGYRVVMGQRLSKTTQEINDYQRLAREFIASINKSYVDFFPVLDQLPSSFQPWRSYWSEIGQRHRQITKKLWEPVSLAVKDGTAKPSFVRDTLLRQDIPYKEGNEEEAMYLAATIIVAGSDNTRMVLFVFMMAMISHPKVFAKARAEVDKVCTDGSNLRLPQITDMKELPYFLAMIKEVLRWRPVIPHAPQHQLTEDLEYGGYYFPKGTNFVINILAACQAVDRPNEFDPERWMDGNEDNITHGLWVFGGGRRVCVGYRILQQMSFIAMTRLIFCFDIVPGGPFNIHNLNLFSEDEPFRVAVKIRGPQYQELIDQDLRDWNDS